MFSLLPLDVAPVPAMLFAFGVPALIFFIIVGLVVLAVKLIKKLSRSAARKEAERLGASTPPVEKSDTDDTP